MSAPKGNNNAAKGRDWADALKWALDNYEGSSVKKGQALRAIATKVVAKAIDGDKDSIQELGNRLDGKPVQAIEGTGAGGALTIELVRYGADSAST